MLEQRGADVTVVGVSADTVDDLKRIAADYAFPLVADPALASIDRYGLRHPGGHPFHGGPIARPGVFLIDAKGLVRQRWLTLDWRVRVRPEQVLAALDELGR